EILSTFEEINIQLTQIKNVFDDGVAAIKEDKAYELFASELEQLQKNVTMVRNVTLNNEENKPYITEEIEDQALAYLSAIDQTIATKQTWAEESYNAGTLAADLDEILSTFEEVNILLTQYMNWFNDQMSAAHNDAAMEEISVAIEGLNKQLTQMMNSTVYNEDEAAWLDEETFNSITAIFSGISQQIMTRQTWAEESWSKVTLADDLDQIYKEFEPIQIAMTQAQNVFFDAVDQAKNDSAFEAFFGEYEMYQMQLTNLVKLANEAENEEALSAISAVNQQLEQLMTWATESYEAGTLFDEYEEIVSNFPGIQALINQVKNTYFAD
ncbi:MAG: hypothetical protein MJZ16_11610, partial [Bacteroidales bacterium]|nr:hypothetical protein [Bacteroidales bacterium]